MNLIEAIQSHLFLIAYISLLHWLFFKKAKFHSILFYLSLFSYILFTFLNYSFQGWPYLISGFLFLPTSYILYLIGKKNRYIFILILLAFVSGYLYLTKPVGQLSEKGELLIALKEVSDKAKIENLINKLPDVISVFEISDEFELDFSKMKGQKTKFITLDLLDDEKTSAFSINLTKILIKLYVSPKYIVENELNRLQGEPRLVPFSEPFDKLRLPYFLGDSLDLLLKKYHCHLSKTDYVLIDGFVNLNYLVDSTEYIVDGLQFPSEHAINGARIFIELTSKIRLPQLKTIFTFWDFVVTIDEEGHTTQDDLIEAIGRAIEKGVAVIAIPYAVYCAEKFDEAYDEVLDVAKKNNISVVVAAGNDGIDARENYLAKIPYTWAVTGTNHLGERLLEFNSTSQLVKKVATMGDNINFDSSKENDNLYGTSFSASIFATAIAIIKSIEPNINESRLEKLIYEEGIFEEVKNKNDNTKFFNRNFEKLIRNLIEKNGLQPCII